MSFDLIYKNNNLDTDLSIEFIKQYKKDNGISRKQLNRTILMILCCFNITKEYINILKDEIGLTDFYGETALMFLCSNRTAILKKEIIEMLYDEIGMQDNSGETALMKYMKYRNNNEIDLEIIKSLSKEIGIRDKYNYNVLYDYLTSTNTPDENIVKILSKEIDGTIYFNGSLLMIYCKQHFEEFNLNILKFFKDEIGIQNKNGDTALMLCMIYRSSFVTPEVIEFFKDEIGIQNNNGKTALMIYMENIDDFINPEVIKSLSAEIGIQDKNGNTALINYIKYTSIIIYDKYYSKAQYIDCCMAFNKYRFLEDTILNKYEGEYIYKNIIEILSKEISLKDNNDKDALYYYVNNDVYKNNKDIIDILDKK